MEEEEIKGSSRVLESIEEVFDLKVCLFFFNLFFIVAFKKNKIECAVELKLNQLFFFSLNYSCQNPSYTFDSHKEKG